MEDVSGSLRAAADSSYVALPKSLRMIWVSTQKAMAAADLITPAPTGRYLLHNAVGQMTAIYDEFATAHVVVLDVPPAAEA